VPAQGAPRALLEACTTDIKQAGAKTSDWRICLTHMPHIARLGRSVGLAVGDGGCGLTCPCDGVGAAQRVG
jgi:hypothetical protein